MTKDKECLLLKWGTVKGWSFLSDKSVKILQRWVELGYSMSAAMQEDTPEQKIILCELIDNINGTITNDWTGKEMTKDQAKKYVTEYK